MAKTDVSRRLDAVQGPVAAFLASRGFWRQRRTFNRELEEPGVIQVVRFEMGPYPIGKYEFLPWRPILWGKFAVSVGVFIPELWLPLKFGAPNSNLPKFPHEYDCEIRSRLFDPEVEQDHWWELSADEGSTSEDVISKLKVFGLPLLERFSRRQAIVDSYIPFSEQHYLMGGGRSRLVVAIILLHLNRRAEAQALFSEHIKRSSDYPGHLEFVRSLAKELGLNQS